MMTMVVTIISKEISDGEYDIPGYRLYRNNRYGNNGGVAVLAREDLFVTRREDLEIDSVEALWLEIGVPKSRSFLIGTFYRPDCTSSYYDKDFIFKLNNILDTTTAQNQEILLCGDFNCFFLHAKRDDHDCKQLKSLFRCFDLKQLITKPTRITKDTKSLTDLIAVSHPQNIRDHEVITSHLSDHELVYCVRKINWSRKSKYSEIMQIVIPVIFVQT